MKNLFYLFPYLWIFSSILFFSCSEEPIPYDLSDAPLHVDSLILYNKVSGFTYQVPPEMGNLDKLYLGNDGGFINEFILLQISSSSYGTSLSSLLADTVTIDSAFLELIFSNDSIPNPEPPPFQLSFFTKNDSIFHENDSHNGNFSLEVLDSVLINTSSLTEAEPDSTEEITPTLIFDVTDSMRVIADTLNSHTFLISLVDEYNGLIAFNSRESNANPKLSVYYRKFIPSEGEDKDTLILGNTFYTVKDVSIIIPPDTTLDYVSNLYVGRALGLKSILSINLDTLQFLPAQTIFRTKSYLNLPYDITLIADKITIKAFPLADTVDSAGYVFFSEGDPYSEHSDYDYLLETSWNTNDGFITINIQTLLQYVHFGELNNLGIKLYSSLDNDPFKTIHFSNFNNEINPLENPFISIQYVIP